MDRKISRWILWIAVLLIALLGVSAVSLCVGSAGIPFRKIISLLLEGRGSAEYSILLDIRLPRILLGFAIGGSLSLAGVILQGMFRNPLVEPYTLGISGAAALGVCINIVLRLYRFLGLISLPVFGFLGAIIVIAVIYSLSLRKGILRMQGLLLTGVMFSFISSSLIMLIMAVSHTRDLHGIVFWVMGSLQEPDWFLIKAMSYVSITLLFVSYFFSLDLNALSLGEEEAQHLGINVERTKKLLFAIASLLTAFSVSVAGIIGFVGLVVPHFVRMFAGSDHRILLVASFLSGAAFLIFCDTLSRTIIAPMELPVGVITGILGGSLFIYALTKRKAVLGAR
ncbi:MAG: iron ABC transporter permease [Candidatus Omnitrophica bacterium]|nr:iron ABC transporter permease [Candidatus Omnitrophota bacterium]